MPVEPPGHGLTYTARDMSAALVSIVVPVHNEAAHIGALIPAMVTEVVAAVGPQELLIVENGSTDATNEEAERICEGLAGEGWKARVLSLPAPDYGMALRHGFAEASGDWIVNFDVDYFSGAFVADAISQDGDIVIASKRAPGSTEQRSWFRRSATAVFNYILRYLLSSQVSDTHGIKAFRRPIVDRFLAATRSNQDLFDTELILRAERSGAVIVELPVVVEEHRAARSLLKRVLRTLRGILKLRRLFAEESR